MELLRLLVERMLTTTTSVAPSASGEPPTTVAPISLWRAAYLTIPTTVTPPSASGDVATTATTIPTAPSSASGDVATATRVILPTLEGGPGDDGADFLNDGDADGEEWHTEQQLNEVVFIIDGEQFTVRDALSEFMLRVRLRELSRN